MRHYQLSRQILDFTWVTILIALLGCDQNFISSDVPEIKYTVWVTDSLTQKPLDSVSVEVIGSNADSSLFLKTDANGRVMTPAFFSKKATLFLTRSGYIPKQIQDSIGVWDTASKEVINRVVKVALFPKTGAELKGVEAAISVKDQDMMAIKGATAVWTDALGIKQSLVNNDSSGILRITGLATGENQIDITAQKYLGARIFVKVTKGSDSLGSVSRLIVKLHPLKYGMSGTVFAKSISVPIPLPEGDVEFRLADSSSLPLKFRTSIQSDKGKEGAFSFDSLPGLPGELWVIRKRGGLEPIFRMPVTANAIIQDGPLDPILVDLPLDSLSIPLLIKVPPDTLGEKDSLVFEFNQAVSVLEKVRVGIVNVSPEVFLKISWDDKKKRLALIQTEGTWKKNLRYDYELSARNAGGQYFSLAGSNKTNLSGSFAVRNTSSLDTNLLFPNQINWAYFNSGENPRFDSLNINSSPKCDSTTRFAKLAWKFASGSGRKVDSLVLFLRDNGVVAPDWTRLEAFPASIESVTVDFSLWYAMSSTTSQKPLFPIRTAPNEKIFAMLVPKQGTLLLGDKKLDLETLTQAMGPSIWVQYPDTKNLANGDKAKDSLLVQFTSGPTGSSPPFNFGDTPPDPSLIFEGPAPAPSMSFKWVDAAKGQGLFRYQFTGFPPLNSRFRVDLHGKPFAKSVLWLRNRNAEAHLP